MSSRREIWVRKMGSLRWTVGRFRNRFLQRKTKMKIGDEE